MTALAMVRSFEMRRARSGSAFATLRLNLGRAGDFAQVDAKIWGVEAALAQGLAQPSEGDLLEVEYRTDEYQGRPQWIVQSWRVLAGDERQAALAGFTPEEQIDRRAYRERLDSLIEQTDEAGVCGQILREIYDDAAFREAFYHAPAARDHHQNYPGGLLEHTVNVTALALALADSYAGPGREGLTFNSQPLPLDREVLVAAGLLHDIGKVETYKFSPLPELTDANAWEGHLAISYAAVRRVAERLLAGPIEMADADRVHKLLHCILSHHGSLEFGSPVAPACAEAFLLAQADMTDARLAEIASFGVSLRQQDPSARWIGRQMHFPGGVFIGDWPGATKPKQGDTP